MGKFKVELNFLFSLLLLDHVCVGSSVDGRTCQARYSEVVKEKLFECEKMTMLQVNEKLVRIASMEDTINLKLSEIIFIKNEVGRIFLNREPSLPKGFYKSRMNLKYLSLRNMKLKSIEANAFNTKQFANLMTLELIQVPITSLIEGIFTGLQKLKVLHLRGLNIHLIAANALKPLENLESLTINGCGKDKIFLNNLFGYGKLMRLANVTIRSCNVRDTITEATFTGLPNVSELRLENNRISNIGARSFNTPFKTLDILSLQGNELKVLPDDLFNVPNGSFVRINLENNQWHCDCKMEKFRRFAVKANEFVFSRIECNSPPKYKGKHLFKLRNKLCRQDISLSPLDTKPQKLESEKEQAVHKKDEQTSVSVDITNGKPLPTCTVTNTEMPFQLNQSNYTLKPLNDALQQIRYRNGKLIVNSKYFPRHLSLIGFEQTLDNMNKNLSECWINEKVNEEKQVIIKSKLASNQAYQLCWVENHLITPFNCMTFQSYVSENVDIDFWLNIEHKPIFITIVSVSAVVASLIGIALAYGCAMLFPKQFSQQKPPQSNDRSSTPKEMDAIRQMRLAGPPSRRRFSSKRHKRPSSSKAVTFFGRLNENESDYATPTEIPPPLPPRNKKIAALKNHSKNGIIL